MNKLNTLIVEDRRIDSNELARIEKELKEKPELL